MEILILASGSKGNATYLKTKDTHILIDAGISYSKMKAKLLENKIDINIIDTVLLTHEHTDHTIGLKQLLKMQTIKKVYLTQGTYKAIKKDIENDNIINIIKADSPFLVNDTKIHPIMTFHDAKEPIGFLISDDQAKMAYLTDTGYVHKSYYDLLLDLDLYVLEANHHPYLLINSTRPFHLKRRILGDKGHLSNEDAIYLLNQVVKTKKTTFIAAHISEECNSIMEIEKELVKSLKRPDLVDVYFATCEGLKVIKV
ncbi:MBL fold metallo-hydrolase [Acholeplasma sp. OttesenSCG-928-E16]|nr:MBL fold metallo-hydrolase [Acholeplasma sp. OttesenSCG-928-E16]